MIDFAEEKANFADKVENEYRELQQYYEPLEAMNQELNEKLQNVISENDAYKRTKLSVGLNNIVSKLSLKL